MPEHVFQLLQKVRVGGRPLRISRHGDSSPASGRRPDRGPRPSDDRPPKDRRRPRT
jgi:hypothetical protein